ncbi:MAG: hypothetical protein HUJ51_00070 [Eggerthellaceae bacterium]|nr:hypothetical protein [Eggerthellaceae bacterium]
MEIEKIKELIASFVQSRIAVLEVEEKGTRILMKKLDDKIQLESSAEELIEESETYPEPSVIDKTSRLAEKPMVEPVKEASLKVMVDHKSLRLEEAEKQGESHPLNLEDVEKHASSKETVQAKQSKEQDKTQVEWLAIKSPMVGTFRSAKSAGEEAMAKPGDQVNAQQSVCLIEAMNILNEIEAGQDGIVRKVCKQDGEPIEFGSVLFYIEPVESLSV